MIFDWPLREDVTARHAAIIDKDRTPKSAPAKLEHLTPERVEAFFAARDERLFG